MGHVITAVLLYTVSQKKIQAKLFLSKLCQISRYCDNFWHKDGTQSEII